MQCVVRLCAIAYTKVIRESAPFYIKIDDDDCLRLKNILDSLRSLKYIISDIKRSQKTRLCRFPPHGYKPNIHTHTHSHIHRQNNSACFLASLNGKKYKTDKKMRVCDGIRLYRKRNENPLNKTFKLPHTFEVRYVPFHFSRYMCVCAI